MKVNIRETLLEQLIGYYTSENEAGGAVFGKSLSSRQCYVEALSVKQGEINSISFDGNDLRLFHPPQGMSLIGTWHTHLHQKWPKPSLIDYYQWSQWSKELVHIIVCENIISVFKTHSIYGVYITRSCQIKIISSSGGIKCEEKPL